MFARSVFPSRQVLLRECRAIEVLFTLVGELKAVLATSPSPTNVNFAIKVLRCTVAHTCHALVNVDRSLLSQLCVFGCDMCANSYHRCAYSSHFYWFLDKA